MSFDYLAEQFATLAWGPWLVIFLVGSGVFFLIFSGLRPFKYLPHAFALLTGKYSKESDVGDVSHFKALTAALSGTIGLGNIAGVAVAIQLGGPGAIFWMWLTALVGMATKYAEAFLAIFYRDRNKQGNFVGGPMYYIKNGLEKKYHFLAYAFAFFGMIAAFGIGNGVQSNSVAQVVSMELNISQVTVGFIIAILVMLVILGGIKSIAFFICSFDGVRAYRLDGEFAYKLKWHAIKCFKAVSYTHLTLPTKRIV